MAIAALPPPARIGARELNRAVLIVCYLQERRRETQAAFPIALRTMFDPWRDRLLYGQLPDASGMY